MILTKASVFIRTVGSTEDSASFLIPQNGNLIFDAANFSKLEQGSNSIVFDNSISGFYGTGYLKSIYNQGSYSVVSYPVSSEKAGKYNLFLRVRTDSSTLFNCSILINGIDNANISTTIVNNQWVWVSCSIVIKDNKPFTLSIRPETSDGYIDSVLISNQSSVPSVIEYQKRFNTLHFKMFSLNNDLSINQSLPIYAYKTTREEITGDNWYNFELSPLYGNSSVDFTDKYAAALFVSGSSPSSYLIWDYANKSDSLNKDYKIYSLKYDSLNSIWSVDLSNTYAMKFYSFRDSLNEDASKIIVPASALDSSVVNKFDSDSLEPVFVQTKVVENGVDSNKVELDLPDKLVSIIVDQSGSMTWNDSNGLRHEITQRMIDRLQSTYPGEVKYNLLSLGSTPIKINFFAVVEDNSIDTDDIRSVAGAYFSDQESGYSGVRIIRKEGSYPTSPLDGEIVTEGFLERTFDGDLIEDTNYFYAAYTFDSNQNFSNGTFLTATPRVKINPFGVGGYTYRVVSGSGVRRDSNTIGLWHLNEAFGNNLYDFSNNPILLTSNQEVTWLNDIDVPSGVSGVRFNGSNNNFYGFDSKNKLIKDKYTFMAWVYCYNSDSNRIIISRETESLNKISFKFGISQDSKLFFTMDDDTFAYSYDSLELNKWHHVAVTVDEASLTANFFIDGVSSGSGNIDTLAYHSKEPMNVYIGGKNSSFFGKITEVSVHDSIRNINYISEAAFLPENFAEKTEDNGDRIVVLKYSIPDDYNFPGGSVKIIKKPDFGSGKFSYESTQSVLGSASESYLVFNGFSNPPSNYTDGELVYETEAFSGENTVILTEDYIHDKDYYFRIFSKNLIGNYSLDSDSPTLKVKIPPFVSKQQRNSVISVPLIEKIKNAQVKNGNNKAYITWDSISDENTDQVLIYWSDASFPIINNEDQVNSSSLLVFSGSKSDVSFVDRNLENEIVNYYTIVAADRYGNVSEPVYISCIPDAEADESGIPLLEVENFKYEIVNQNSLSLSWSSPVKFQKDINAWFDERIVLYAQVTDEYGSPIADLSKIKFTSKADLQSSDLAEDVFSENVNFSSSNPDPKNFYSISSTVIGNGLIKGVMKMTPNLDLLSSLKLLTVDVNVSYYVPDKNNKDINVFEFTSLPIHFELRNPFDMQLINIGDNSSNFGTINTSTNFRKKTKRRRGTGSSSTSISNSNEPVPDSLLTSTSDIVSVICKQEVPLNSPSFIATGGIGFDVEKFKKFDGCWIRRTRPFMARVVVTYKGQSLPSNGNCNVAVFEASDPQCDPDDTESDPCSTSLGSDSAPIKWQPSFSTRRSRSVQPPATSIQIQNGLQRMNDGSTKEVSYVDIPLKAPRSPQAIMLFAQTGYNGFFSRKKMYVVFENILRIETTIKNPEPNCIDVAEQQAGIYMIDPDSPEVQNPRKIPVPNQQVIRWDLKKGYNSKDRPFYSTDNVPSATGVFSLSRDGSARKVFFGPACGVTWLIYNPCPNNIILLPEMYAIRASVVYDGLTAFEERPIIIYPDNFESTSFGSRFLMQTPSYINSLYADGYDLLKVDISHDPNIVKGAFGDCFNTCASNANRPLFSLSNGQIVQIESGNEFEILYGDGLKTTYDPDLEEYVVTDNNQVVGFAQIPLSQEGNTTSFYLRINKFVGKPQEGGSSSQSSNVKNVCECVDLPEGVANKPGLSVISGKTSININGETRYLRGGGDLRTGIPPTVVDLKEPLEIFIVDIRRGGERINKVLCDGISVHEFVVEVTFKGKPVPNGTPVFLTIGGSNPDKVILQSDVVYTEKKNDSLLNPNGSERSFASFYVAPFGAESAFSCQIQAETQYDKRGDVERTMTCCVTIKYDPSQPKEDSVVVNKPEGEINNVFSASLEAFDTQLNTWTSKSFMKHPRGCLTLNWAFDAYEDKLFAIGGLDGTSILSYNESYDVSNDTWTTKSPMNTPRFYHTSVYDAGYVYVFGGITSVGNNLLVTRKAERYDIANDKWEYLPDMPASDQNSYGLAFASSVVIGDKAYFLGGINRVGISGSVDSINDRILVFNFDTLEWSFSDKFTGEDLALYQRISPFAFVDSFGDYIYVSGGSIPGKKDEATGSQPLNFITSTFKVNIENFNIQLNDSEYKQIPSPRYRGICASIGDDHYFIGGTNSKSKVLNLFDLVTENLPSYDYYSLPKMPQAKTAFGGCSDYWRYVYTCGGLTSGRPPGFLQIKSNVSPSYIRLDGKQSATVTLNLIDDVGEPPTKPVKVLVQGILLFTNAQASSSNTDGGDQSQQGSQESAFRDALVYPVVFTSNNFYIYNGKGSTVMLPRSDDILRKVSDIKSKLGINDSSLGEGSDSNILKITEGQIRNPYSIKIRITVVDEFYYGQTVIDVKDNQDTKQVPIVPETVLEPASAPIQNTNSENNNNKLFFTNCRSIDGSQAIDESSNQETNDTGRDSENNQTIDQSLKESKNPVFDLSPPQSTQLQSPEVSYYSDIDWIPQVVTHVNIGDYFEVSNKLNIIRNEIPFGASPLYDAIVKNSLLMLDDSLDVYSKVIYVNTDNEENFSVNNIETTIEEVQAIDGFSKVPVIINNFSVVFPVTLSALVSRTDTDSLDKISIQTGGQSQTILDSQYIDEVLNNSIGRVSGSIGWGVYECIIDLNQNSIINSIKVNYDLFMNTDGSWKMSTSEDGFNYSEYSDSFNANKEVTFVNVNARYIKFNITLLSGLSAFTENEYDNIPTPGSPAITGIKIDYSVPTESFIYLNKELSTNSPQQVAVSVSSNKPDLSTIQVAATTSDSHNWQDYISGSKPSVESHGKIFIPIRYKQDQDSTLNESLENVDGFMWKTKYGKWDETSNVEIFDSKNNTIDKSYYKLYPKDGLIVFSSKQTGPLFIGIEDSSNLKIGVRIVNRDHKNGISIDGLGYMYNTNEALPSPLSKRPPTISNLRVTPSSTTVYSKISLTYKYFNINQRDEDFSKTEIRWYINGVEVEYLRNLRSWNNIEDTNDPIWIYAFTFLKTDIPSGSNAEQFARQRGESILKVGDSIYVTVKVSDGETYGEVVRSPSNNVLESPPFIESVVIKGKKNDGSVQSSVTTATRAFADFSSFQEGSGSAKSQIIWYVNQVEFKRGDLGATVGGISNNEILAGEIKNNITGIAIGNVLQVTIIPASNNIIGNPVSSDFVSVENDPPSVRNVILSPSPNAPSASALQVVYTYVDVESQRQGSTQNDQSSIRWLRAARGSSTFEEVASLQNLRIVNSVNTSFGQKWKAEVIPFDGISTGTPVQSNTVTIV